MKESNLIDPVFVLVGHPNSGKTTLFNELTGLHYKTVNYPGSTVSFYEGRLSGDEHGSIRVMDTPGITSLTSSAPDQIVTQEVLYTYLNSPHVIAVIDATQIARQWYIVQQLIDSGIKPVVCLTMVDLLKDLKASVDESVFSTMTSLTILKINTDTGLGVTELRQLMQSWAQSNEIKIKPERPSVCGLDEIQEKFRQAETLEKKVLKFEDGIHRHRIYRRDKWLLHPVFGSLIFAFVLAGIFTSIYWLAGPFMDQIDALFSYLIDQTKNLVPGGIVADILADGLIAGIGSVVIFLPQIIILFLVMNYLEDTGYLARGATLIDRPLQALGLNGRAFVPLMSGFACAIPAMMAARTISSYRERMITLFIIPLMSCSARLPVYTLLVGFITPPDKPWIGGVMMAGLYIGGIVMGTLAATLISRLKSLHSKSAPFLLELPAYRKPKIKIVLVSTFHKALWYLKKAGPVIVLISIGLWLFTHLPYRSQETQNETENIEYVSVSESYAALVGKHFEVLTRPMGLDWRCGVAIIMGFAAREVFVGALNLLYRIDEADDEDLMQAKLLQNMREVTFEGTSQKIFTPSSVLGLLFFFAVALQCFPTVVTFQSEIGSWKIPLIQLFVYSGIAYLGAIIIVQSLRLFGFS